MLDGPTVEALIGGELGPISLEDERALQAVTWLYMITKVRNADRENLMRYWQIPLFCNNLRAAPASLSSIGGATTGTRRRTVAAKFVLVACTFALVPPAFGQSAAVDGYSGVAGTGRSDFSTGQRVEVAQSDSVTYSFPQNRFATDTSQFYSLASLGRNAVYAGVTSQAFGTTAGANSVWSDVLTINSSARRGTIRIGLDLTGSIVLDPGQFGFAVGSISYSLSASSVAYGVNFGPAFGPTPVGIGAEQEIDRSVGQLDRYSTLRIPFMNGNSFSVRSQATCSVNARGAGPETSTAVAICAAGNSFYWAGVLDVLDENGNAIADWTLTSASGTDYRRSFVPVVGVPEPASWALMTIGFGLAGTLSRFRHGTVAIRSA